MRGHLVISRVLENEGLEGARGSVGMTFLALLSFVFPVSFPLFPGVDLQRLISYTSLGKGQGL